MPDNSGEHQNGNAQSANNSGENVLRVAGSDSPAVTVVGDNAETALIKLPRYAVVILSGGTVVALYHFITLCFAHPDAANIVLPLIVTTVMPLIVGAFKNRSKK